jgi:hypothetical protein
VVDLAGADDGVRNRRPAEPAGEAG